MPATPANKTIGEVVGLRAELDGEAAARLAGDERTLKPPVVVTIIGGQEDESPTGSNATIAADTTNKVLGAQGWKATATGASNPSMRLVPSTGAPFTHKPASALGLKVYIPDVTKITAITVTVWNDAGFTSGLRYERASTSNYNPALVNGWNTLRWPNGPAPGMMSGTVYRVDVTGTNAGGTGSTFTVGHMWLECHNKAQMVVVADSAYSDFVNNAYPSLKARGVPVTWAIDPALLGTGSGNTARATEAQIATLAAENRNVVSFHGWDGSATTAMTAAQIRADCMKAIKWLQGKGYSGHYYRAAWVQDAATNYAAANPLLLFGSTWQSLSGVHCWPPVNRYDIPRASLIPSRTTAAVDTWFTQLQATHGLIIIYTHDVSDSPGAYGCTTALWNHVLSCIDTGTAGGWLEAVTLEDLAQRIGIEWSQGFGGSLKARYHDGSAEVSTLMP